VASKSGKQSRVPVSFPMQMANMLNAAHRRYFSSVQTLAPVRKPQSSMPSVQYRAPR
jgi:hypothetical protein